MGTFDKFDNMEGSNGVKWWFRNFDERVGKLEDLKLDVMKYELGELRKDVTAMKRAFYTFAFSVVLAAIIFAFSVITLIGKK